MTQEQLAELTELSADYISRLEISRTSASIETIVKLARALNVEVGELFKFDEK